MPALLASCPAAPVERPLDLLSLERVRLPLGHGPGVGGRVVVVQPPGGISPGSDGIMGHRVVAVLGLHRARPQPGLDGVLLGPGAARRAHW